MTETMPTEILIDRMGATHQAFISERMTIIRAFLAGLTESEQLELIERDGENIQSQVAEALAHSPHPTVKQALMDATEELTPDVAPFFAWATIATVEYDSDDDEQEANSELQQQALDAIENNSASEYLIVAMDAAVNG